MTVEHYEYQAGVSNWGRAAQDVKRAWARRRLWADMTIRAFLNQYRGAAFGAFWLTITTGMTAAGLGLLYGQLFGVPLQQHLPYVTCALVVWSLISGFILGGCSVFVGNAHTFKEFPLPFSLFVFRLTLLQFIMFALRILVLAAVIVLFRTPLDWKALYSAGGVLLLFWIGFWVSLTLGVINARYRDFGQLTGAFLTIAFFLTPIFWLPERLGDYAVFVNLNPFYHLIEVVRAPLLARGDIALHFAVVGAIAVAAPIVGGFVFGRLSHRLPYWC